MAQRILITLYVDIPNLSRKLPVTANDSLLIFTKSLDPRQGNYLDEPFVSLRYIF